MTDETSPDVRADPCKVFVAAYTERSAIVVFTNTDLVTEEISNTSAMLEDCMPGHNPPSDGLWMFEGEAFINNDPEGAEVWFKGEWRRPTDVELSAAGCGENPCITPCGAE